MYNADAAGDRGELRDFVVYQAAERTMVTSSGGMCQSMTLDGESLPGGVTREDITAAQAEMQRALEQIRILKLDPPALDAQRDAKVREAHRA